MNGKFKLFTAIVAAGLLSVPAMAADFVPVEAPTPQEVALTGNIALWGTVAFPHNYFNENDSTPCDPDGEFCRTAYGFGGDARMHYRFNDAFGVQLELLGEYLTSMNTSTVGADSDEPLRHLAGGLHAIWRGNPMLPVGVFAGLAGTHAIARDDTPLHVFGGFEAAMISRNQTYFGQIGGAWMLGDTEDSMRNLVFARLGARHFFNPNSRLEGAIAAGYSPDFDTLDPSPDKGTWLQFAVEYEKKHDNNPFSWFARYQGDYVKADEPETSGDESVWTHAAKIGVRMTFGPTLQYENDTGARTFTFTNLSAPIGYANALN